MGVMFRRVIGLWVAMVVFTGASMLVGRAQPPPDPVRQLRLDDCRAPCWIGIQPGRSSVIDAYRQLQAAFGLLPRRNAYAQLTSSQLVTLPLNSQDEHNTILVELEIVRGIPREIRIPARFGNDTYLGKMPRLGDVMNLFGKPTCIMTWGVGIRGWSLIYDTADGVIEVGLKGARFLHWSQPIYYLSLRQPNAHYAVNECFSPGSPLLTWGATRVWR